MTAQSLPSLDEQHAETAKKQPSNEPAEYKRVDACTDKALIARRKDDPQNVGANITVLGRQQGTVVQFDHPVDASILIARIGIDCMPAAYREHIDDVVQQMAEGMTQGDALKPIDRPVWYELGTTKVHFSGAESASTTTPSGTDSDGKKDHTWIASFAFVLNGNLITIYLESNDLPFMNEMLHGNITLGKQFALQLFQADLGHGTPIQAKP